MKDEDVAVAKTGQKWWLSREGDFVVQVEESSPISELPQTCRYKPHALRTSISGV
jgi:hypothetical protein